jgi:hypothetical protein
MVISLLSSTIDFDELLSEGALPSLFFDSDAAGEVDFFTVSLVASSFSLMAAFLFNSLSSIPRAACATEASFIDFCCAIPFSFLCLIYSFELSGFFTELGVVRLAKVFDWSDNKFVWTGMVFVLPLLVTRE